MVIISLMKKAKVNKNEKNYWEQIGFEKLSSNNPFEDLTFQSLIKENNLKNKKILEIGPGKGNALAYFQSLNCQLYALDIAKTVIEYLKKHFKGNFIIGDVRNINQIFNQQFDFIYARWSLIHLSYQDFKSFLINVQKLLKTQGQIFIALRYGDNLNKINLGTKMQSLELNEKTLKVALPKGLKVNKLEVKEFTNKANKKDKQISFLLIKNMS